LGSLKSCDDRLKKITEEANDVKNKLTLLKKKESDVLTAKDLGDVVYEQKIDKKYFVNTYYDTEILTSCLICVHNKKIKYFEDNYYSFLIQHYKADYESWRKRTLG